MHGRACPGYRMCVVYCFRRETTEAELWYGPGDVCGTVQDQPATVGTAESAGLWYMLSYRYQEWKINLLHLTQ